MNPFSDPSIVAGYEAWYDTSGRRAGRMEEALLSRWLARFPVGTSLLEVGCGTGHFGRGFAAQGYRVAGLDRSLPMLVEAQRLGGPPIVGGDALALPFAQGAVDLVAFVTTLEFLPDPVLALREGLRVARRGLILGVINGQSLLGRRLRRAGGPIWGVARLYTPGELRALVQQAATGMPVRILWRTTLWPIVPWALPLPWGGFTGMLIEGK